MQEAISFLAKGDGFTESKLKSVKTILNLDCSDQLSISKYKYGEPLVML